ncbi:hypothetical protein Nmel_014448 [Mimus melanotis]
MFPFLLDLRSSEFPFPVLFPPGFRVQNFPVPFLPESSEFHFLQDSEGSEFPLLQDSKSSEFPFSCCFTQMCLPLVCFLVSLEPEQLGVKIFNVQNMLNFHWIITPFIPQKAAAGFGKNRNQ